MATLLCPLADVERMGGEKALVLRLPDGLEIGVTMAQGRLQAYENRCPHMGGPVCLGEIIGRTEVELDEKGRVVATTVSETELRLICPWHGLEFDLATGVCPTDPRYRLRPIEVFQRDGYVYAELGATAAGEGEENHG